MAATGGGGGYYSKFYPHFATIRHKMKSWRHPGGALLGINILSVFENPDAIDRDVRTVKEAVVPENETGWDRLRLMFAYDEFGEMSPELSMVIDSLTHEDSFVSREDLPCMEYKWFGISYANTYRHFCSPVPSCMMFKNNNNKKKFDAQPNESIFAEGSLSPF